MAIEHRASATKSSLPEAVLSSAVWHELHGFLTHVDAFGSTAADFTSTYEDMFIHNGDLGTGALTFWEHSSWSEWTRKSLTLVPKTFEIMRTTTDGNPIFRFVE